MNKTSIEIVNIGIDDTTVIDNAISFLNRHQNAFLFKPLRENQFTQYKAELPGRYTTMEIYELFDCVLLGLKGFHHLVIGVVESRLDGKKWGNLFGSMQTENEKLVGKAITSTYGVQVLIHPMPLELYLIYEFLSFASRFVVGRGMIHDDEPSCLSHRKVQKTVIRKTLQTGYLCITCQQKINQYLDLTQILAFRTILSIISKIANSDNPQKDFQDYMAIEDILGDKDIMNDISEEHTRSFYPSEKSQIPFPLQEKVFEFLASIPNIHDMYGQKAFIAGAGLDAQLERQITFGGSITQFFRLLIPTLTTYGKLEDGQHALVAILDSAKKSIGGDRQRYADSLIQNIQQSRPKMPEDKQQLRIQTNQDNESTDNIPSPRPVSDIRKTKVLFLGANPVSTSRLQLDEEIKSIQTNFKIAKERDHLVLKQEWAVTINLLLQSILDESPTIVHFSGHGTKGGIILQDDSGVSKTVSADALANLFNLFQDCVYCVVLNSCYSKDQAKAIRQHIPYVIGMEAGIHDKAALAFSTGFYKAIGAGRNIPFAFKLGVTTIKLEGIGDDSLPILL